MLLRMRDLNRLDAAMLSQIPDDLLLELCRIDEGLDAIPAPVYASQIEQERVGEECRSSFLAWCVEALKHEGLKPAAHHRLLIEYLQRVADGEITRLMIFMPPGSAKSKFTSELLPAWFMAHRPGEPIIGASHTGKLALRFSARVQRYVRAFGQILGTTLITEAKERWETDRGSEYLAVGVGGAVPGYRADLCIIDDPFSGRDDADSESMRDRAWNWYTGDIIPRIKPEGRTILMHTRWHEDDLAGRLLKLEPEKWTVLKLPAIATGADDPLGRAIGEPMWADDSYGFGAMLLRVHAAYEQQGKSREWASQYQQEPRPLEGALFKTARIEVLDIEPSLRGAAIGRGWDLAATKKVGTNDPDWTVGIKLGRMPSGLFVVLDVHRIRGGPDEVDNGIRNIASQDGREVKIGIPQDPGQAGKAQVLAFTRLLVGHWLETSVETGDKATRAAPAVSQVNNGNFAIVRAPWNAAFLDELSAFPSGTKDDQVDALSRAFSLVGLAPKPVIVSSAVLAVLGQRA